MNSNLVLALLLSLSTPLAALAAPAVTPTIAGAGVATDANELNPADPNIEQKLKAMDKDYQSGTGLSPSLPQPTSGAGITDAACDHENCKVFAEVDKAAQRIHVYVEGQETYTWPVSTGREGFTTPNFDTHPSGRIYDVYSSSTYPGFDNMPFAVFISGGYAIHGAPGDEQNHLGTVASHGCVRVQTEHAKIFNRLVRQYGMNETWITVK